MQAWSAKQGKGDAAPKRISFAEAERQMAASRRVEHHDCGHVVTDWQYRSPLCPDCERRAFAPDRLPAVLTITIRDSGRVHRFAIPKGMVPAKMRTAGRKRRAMRA